ncbi:MAG: EAL domain-containing protein [Lachnospiraceae bacterium]|nr:EAL domain-containing protein [Lachnospiraceae bacterium]
MQKKEYNEVINLSSLKKIQGEYSRVAGVATVCCNIEGEVIGFDGELPGITDDDNWAVQFTELDVAKELLRAVGEDSIEDVSFMRLPGEKDGEGCWLAAVAIRIEGHIVSIWLIAAPGSFTERQLIDRTDMLRDTCSMVYAGRLNLIDAEIKNIKRRDAEGEQRMLSKAYKANSNLFNLLGSKAATETIFQLWLETAAGYLESDGAAIYRFEGKGNGYDILAEYVRKGYMPPFVPDEKKEKGIEALNRETPVILSSDALNREENRVLSEAGIKAIITMPIIMKSDGSGNMLAVFRVYDNERQWSSEDVRFISDAVKLIQSIIVTRINRNSLAGSFQALEDILNNIGVSFYLTSKDGKKIIFVNKMLIETFETEWKGGKLHSQVIDGISNLKYEQNLEIYNSRLDRWYEVSSKEIEWVDGSAAILYTLYDVTDRKLHQSKIEQQAFTDFLTGLYNRMCCERDLARLIDEVERDGTQGALIYLDLDDFKHINDGLGHQYGDVLLKSISNAMRSVHGVENNCYRMGGDEFVILIPPSSFDRFEAILTEIKDLFSKPFYLKDSDYYCTSSIGVVTFPDNGNTVQGLIRKADVAMYEAKKSGKNRMARYSSDQDSEAGRRLDMEKNMRDAEDTDYKEFRVYYQPIIDVEDGLEECVGAEALVRWDSKQLGFVSPVDFIPLAEYLGLINPIGDHVLKEACRTVKSWNDRGYDYMKVNVNLSVVQLLQNNIVEIVEQTIKETGLEPRNLTLEVTESLAINDMQRMIGILSKIKALGVSIALDDFGTGYSSLNHIREIPFDIIKVDQSFVRDLAEDAYSQAFVKMVAELAETRGVKICVEGIETPEQYNVVKNFKVKYIQGFYFDKPLPREIFEDKYLR